MTARTRQLSAVVALVAAALLGGCTGPEPRRSPTDDPTSDRVVRFGEPVWQSGDSGVSGRRPPTVGADVIVHSGHIGGRDVVATYDRATGVELWRLDGGVRISGLKGGTLSTLEPWIGTGPGDPVVVTYARSVQGRSIEGVAALDPESGHQQWLWEPSPAAGDLALTGGTSDTVVVAGSTGSYGLDLAAGDLRWQNRSVRAAAVDHGLVIAADAAADAGPSTVVIDADTGVERWRSEGVESVNVADAAHIVRIGDDEADGSTLIELDGGHEMAIPAPISCACTNAGTGDALLVFAGEGGSIGGTTLVPGEQRPTSLSSIADHVAGLLTGGAGLVWAVDSGQEIVALDRAGHRVGGPLPGQLVTVGDDYVVLQRGRASTSTFVVIPFMEDSP